MYQGTVRHTRFGPVEHEFRFPLFMMYLDLSELDHVFAGRWLWSTRRPALARFERSDHLGDPELPLDDTVRDLVETSTGHRPSGPIRLLTQLRYGGYVFNPVSLHYCFGPRGEELEAVVADVTNTPWHERHTYVLGRKVGETRRIRARVPKEFHVSPFMPMDLDYRFQLQTPGRWLTARIQSLEKGGQHVFDAALTLRRRPITTAALARVLLLHPWMTAQTTAGIYWQAFRLFLKHAPFPPPPGDHDVSESTIEFDETPERTSPVRRMDDWARRAVHRRLRGIRSGRLTIVEGGSAASYGDPGSRMEATVFVRSPQFYSAIALRGALGGAESFMDGEWTTDDLTMVIRILARDAETTSTLDRGLARWSRPGLALYNRLRRNTRRGSRRNIAAHYDLSNEFFELFLDETMTYSSADLRAARPVEDMECASLAKLDAIALCRKLDLRAERAPAGDRDRVGERWRSTPPASTAAA